MDSILISFTTTGRILLLSTSTFSASADPQMRPRPATAISASINLSTEFIDSVNSKLFAEQPLIRLEFRMASASISELDKKSMEQIWKDKWGEQAECRFTNGEIKLCVLEET